MVFMAWTLALIGGTASMAGGLQGIFTAITNSSSSFWFIFMMSAEMAITLFFIRDRLPKAFSWLIASQVIIMVLSPTAIVNSVWASLSLAAGSAIMTFLFIYIFKFLHKNQTLSKGILNYLLFLMLAYALMMAGQFIWLLNGDAAVFVLSIIVEMVVYFGIVLDEKKLISSKSVSWQSMPYWVFGFLFLIFVVEFFMSGVMAIQVYGQGFFNGIISASTTWPFTRILSAGFYVGTMAVFTAWLIKKGSEIKTLIDAGIVLFLLSMMATTFISTVVYLYVQASVTLLDLVAINMAVAGVTTVAVLFATRRGNDSLLKNKVGNIRLLLIASIIALVILSEVFMGWTFALLGGTVSISSGLQWVYSALIHATSSFWFIFMMSAEMGITLFFIRGRLPKPFVLIMASQTIIMILSPTAIGNSLWTSISLVAGSAVMVFLFIYVFEFLYKNRTTSSGILNYLLFLMLAYALMMAGQFIWLLNGRRHSLRTIHNSRDGGVLRNRAGRKKTCFIQIRKLASKAVLGLRFPGAPFRGRVLHGRSLGHSSVWRRLFQWDDVCLYGRVLCECPKCGLFQFHNVLHQNNNVSVVPDNDGHRDGRACSLQNQVYTGARN